MDDLGAPLALGFRLPRNGALHLLRDVDLLHFHLGYFNTPGFRILVKDRLQFSVDLFAFGEDFVEFELSDDAAQSGLRLLRSGIEVILHLRKGEVCVYHAEIAHRVYFDGDIVSRDDVLRGHIKRFDTQRDAIQSFDGPEDEAQSRRLCFRDHASEPQNDSAFPFLDHVKRVPEPDQEDDYGNEWPSETE